MIESKTVKKLLEEATPAPWYLEEDEFGSYAILGSDPHRPHVFPWICEMDSEDDAKLVVAAPLLAAKVIEQAAQIKRLKAALWEAEVMRRELWVDLGANIDPLGSVDWETQYDALNAEDMEEI